MDETLAGIQARADEIRHAHEGEVQQRCDGLIKQYRAIAEQATAQAAAFRQEEQLRSMEGLRSAEKDRLVFEKTIMERANGIVTAAKIEAKESAEKLEREREKFARFEVEVRRQFEAHCRNFEGRIRAKALAMLSDESKTSDFARKASAAFDAVQSEIPLAAQISDHVQEQAQDPGQADSQGHQPHSQPNQPNTSGTSSLIDGSSSGPRQGSPRVIMSPAESKQDEKIRRTVAELKQYMASLSSGDSFLESPGPSSLSFLPKNSNSVIKSPPLRQPPPVPPSHQPAPSRTPLNASRKRRTIEQKEHRSPPLSPLPQEQHHQQNPPQHQHQNKNQGHGELIRARSVPIFGPSTTGPNAHRARFINGNGAPQKSALSSQPMSRFVETVVDRSARENTTRLMEGLNSLY